MLHEPTQEEFEAKVGKREATREVNWNAVFALLVFVLIIVVAVF